MEKRSPRPYFESRTAKTEGASNRQPKLDTSQRYRAASCVAGLVEGHEFVGASVGWSSAALTSPADALLHTLKPRTLLFNRLPIPALCWQFASFHSKSQDETPPIGYNGSLLIWAEGPNSSGHLDYSIVSSSRSAAVGTDSMLDFPIRIE